MKRTFAGIILLAAADFGCTRVGMEQSPEALVPYGLPTQQSNSVPHEKQKGDVDTDLNWFQSSAIHPKPTVNR